jgi:hypothetical protein
MTNDRVYEAFLAAQRAEGEALAAASDLVTIEPVGSDSDRYLVRFSCTGLVRTLTGDVAEARRFEVGIWFPPDYLRRAVPWEVLTWLGPRRVLHPNISDRGPFICVGRLSPGTSLVDLVFQCYEIITYQKVTMREDDALNHWACVWARDNQHRFPIDRRPLKRAVRAVA